MRGVQLTELLAGPPDGVAEVFDLVDGFDEALVPGLGRVSAGSGAALSALAGALAGTPLDTAAGEAVDRIAAGVVGDDQLAVLAGARTGLVGAAHDALLDQLDAALGRSRSSGPAAGSAPGGAVLSASEGAASASDDGSLATGDGASASGGAGPLAGSAGLVDAARSWLTELVVAGWRGVDHDLASAADRTVQAMLAEPALRRLAVLLDGFVAELRGSCPVAAMDFLPVRRWADLWARAVLLSGSLGAAGIGAADAGGAGTGGRPGGTGAWSGERVSGRLLPLGVDVHEHPTAVQIQVHGLLEPAGSESVRLVRASLSAAKVDTVVGPALWRLLGGHPVLLAALAGRHSLNLTDMFLTAGGDLWWQDDRARPGEPVDPFAVARVELPGALASAVAPLDRHPVRIAEPVLLEGYTVTADGGPVAFEVDGVRLAVAMDRLPSCGPLTPELVSASTACLGLLRWDAAGWSVQPFAVRSTVKRRTIDAHTADWALGPTDPKVVKALAKAGDAVAVLGERAGRLLRR